MHLSDRDIKKGVAEGTIVISPFDEKKVQPASYDIRLGNKFIVNENHTTSSIDPVKKEFPETKEVIIPDDGEFVLHPGVSILGHSKEFFGSNNHLIEVNGKSSLARIGLLVHNSAALINPGHFLNVALELCNLNNVPIVLRPGMDIAQLTFSPLSSPPEQNYRDVGRYEEGAKNIQSYLPPKDLYGATVDLTDTPKDKEHPEYQYLDLCRDILENGADKELFFNDIVLEEYRQKGEEPPFIRSVFGRQTRYDLSKGFPLLTTKKTFWRGIVVELLWFLSGSTNIKPLVDQNVHIWNEWAWKNYAMWTKEYAPHAEMSQEEFVQKIKELPADDPFVVQWGEIVSAYGRQWRRWPARDGREIDQLAWVIDGLRTKPDRKSYVVSAWNPDFIYAMASEGQSSQAPPACHTMYQFQVADGKLNLGLYQRSADLFLGVPFNIASYALLLKMVSQAVGIPAGEFVHTFGDVHIYSNHFDQVKEQMSREPLPFPEVSLNPRITNIDEFTLDDIVLENYQSHPPLRAEIANIGGFENKKN